MAIQTTTSTPEKNIPKSETAPVQNVEDGSSSVEVKKNIEQVAEVSTEHKENEAAAVAATQSVSQAKDSSTPVAVKSEDLQQIEKILSDGLETLYQDLPENRKQEFRQKGEETARSIERLMQSAKVKVGKVVKLIVEWLKMIPGVNKFFLEQESKIKADRLLEFKKDKEEGTI